MSMDKNRLKDELFNHKSNVNIDEIWSAIEPDVDAINAEKKRKRRAGFLWLFGAGSMLLIILLLSYPFYKKQDRDSLSATTIVQENKSTSDNQGNVKTNKTSEHHASQNNNTDLAEDSTEEQNELIDLQQNSGASIAEDIVSNNKIVKTKKGEGRKSSFGIGEHINATKSSAENYNNNIASDLSLQKTNATLGDENIIDENNKLKAATQISTTENRLDDQKELSFNEDDKILLEEKRSFDEKENIDALKNNAAPETLVASEKESIIDSILTKNTHPSEPVVTFEEQDDIAIKTTPEIASEIDVIAPENKNATEKADTVAVAVEPTLEESNHGGGHHDTWTFAAGIEAGVAIANKTFTEKDTVSQELLSLRNETERSLETTHLGLNFSLGHKSGLEFSTGIHYTRIAELFEYNDSRVTYDSIENAIKFYYINLDEEQVPVYGTIPNHTTITETQKIYNYFHLIDIPLSVAYHYDMERFSIGLETAIFVNLALKTKGRIFDTDFSEIDVKANQETVYQSSAGMSFLVGLPLRYHLNDHMDLSVKPYWRKFPKNFAVNNYALEQRYGLLGLDLGMRWRF